MSIKQRLILHLLKVEGNDALTINAAFYQFATEKLQQGRFAGPSDSGNDLDQVYILELAQFT